MTRQESAAFGRLDRLVDEALAKHGLIAEGESVLIGVSGGPDSVALLHLLLDRAPARRLHLGIAHLNHELRDGADRDEEFVRQLAAALGLPFHGRRARARSSSRCSSATESGPPETPIRTDSPSAMRPCFVRASSTRRSSRPKAADSCLLILFHAHKK